MDQLPHRMLGASDFSVSVMSLGSWRTFERIPRDQGLAVMTAAREAGINFLDDARYDDETGTAPISTGYSEVVFGELFRAAGWLRDEVTDANKLWWEHWPDEDAAAELDGSLGRMGLDHVDLIWAIRPPDGLSVAAVVGEVGRLIASGRARAWGTGMWSAAQHHEALVPPAHIAFAHAFMHPNLASVVFGASSVDQITTTSARSRRSMGSATTSSRRSPNSRIGEGCAEHLGLLGA